MKYVLASLLSLLILNVSGCASSAKQTETAEFLSQINPINDTTAQQVTLKRLSDMLDDPEFSQVDRAELYLQRGLIYDSIGLSHLAYFDFLYALEIKPNLAEAYNMTGIYYLKQKEFSRSYEAFDSAIELQPEHEFAYFNRAIALYYGERAGLANKDFEQFYQFNPSDAFRILWWYFSVASYDKTAAEFQLQTQAKNLDAQAWGTQIAYYVQGKINQHTLLNRAFEFADKGEQNINQNLCEAYFYIGKKLSLMGNIEAAKPYFKAALATHVYEFVEYRYALLELEKLEREALGLEKLEQEKLAPKQSEQ